MARMRGTLVLCLVLLGATPAFALDEILDVPSRTLSVEEVLRGDDSAAPEVTLTGRLQGPDSPEPLPAVILMHGSNGPEGAGPGSWSPVLRELGYATFRLDSFTARGLTQVDDPPSAFHPFPRIYDAYRAVEVLAADPRIDSSRIVVMGWSHGGIPALYSAMTRFQEAFGPETGRIVAHVAFYPACNFVLVDELDVAPVPIREFHGADDDNTLAAPCRDYIDRLAAAGADAEMTEYPDALHDFDNVFLPALNVYDTAYTARACGSRREENFNLINVETGKPFTWEDACVERGVRGQYNDAAAQDAQAQVAALLAEVFAPDAP
jgi:dienelactone hydrolase